MQMNVEYKYYKQNEPDLEPLLKGLEKHIGGSRHPYTGRFGAIDLDPFLWLLIGIAVDPYLTTLSGSDRLGKIGKKHRLVLAKLLLDVKQNTQSLVYAIKQLPSNLLKFKPREERYSPFTVVYPIEQIELHVCLNHVEMDDALFADLPRSVSTAFSHILEIGVPEDTRITQLYFDISNKRWKYLFVPTTRAFGGYIDRFIDLDSGKVVDLDSREHFHEVFHPHEKDEFMFIINPFRSGA